MTREEIYDGARGLLDLGRLGSMTLAEYKANRRRLFEIDGVEQMDAELEDYMRQREGDPENPFGGFCFRGEERPLFVTVNARGEESVSPVRLAEAVRVRENIVKFTNGKDSFSRWFYRGGVYLPCPDERLLELLTGEIVRYNLELYKGSVVKEAAGFIDHAPPLGPLSVLDKNENLVVFRNGTLWLDDMKLRTHEREDYSTVQLNADWTGENEPTPVFSAFLRRLCGGDKEKTRLLMQYLGLCLTNTAGWRIKKALFLYGDGNTGKSVLRGFIERLLGPDNYTNMDLQTLEEDKFASAQLSGKRLAGSSDMGYMKVRQLAIFKQLTGGDEIFAQNKGKKPFTFRYRGLLWFCMNEPPAFGGDRGDWVYDRMILFPCGDTVPEKERDPNLSEKLWAERNGIARRLILAAKSVIEADYKLTVPACLEEKKTAYRRENDPVEKFFTECCRIRPTPDVSPLDECTCKNVFEVFKNWCRDNAPGYPPKKSEFRKTVAALLCLPEEEVVIKKTNSRFFTFFLTEAAKQEYGNELFVKKQF